MTIGAAWLRSTPEGTELWLATDSRLTGDGNIWDDCPKTMLMPRRDCIAAFSGSTSQAYPLLLQLSNAIGSYQASADGSLEFFSVLSHLEAVAAAMLERLKPDPSVHGQVPARREFASSGDAVVLGGYSRRHNGFVIRTLQYQGASGWRFARARPARALGRARVIRIFGDSTSRSRFRFLLKSMLEERGILRDPKRSLDLEPLEALVNFLQLRPYVGRPLPLNRRTITTGGAPQVARLLMGANAMPFAVRWQSQAGVADFTGGRRVMPYERLGIPLLDLTGTTIALVAPGQWSTPPAAS